MEAAIGLALLWPRRVRPESSISHSLLLARLDARRAGAQATIANLNLDHAFERIELVTQQRDLARAAQSALAYQRRVIQIGEEAARPALKRAIVSETAQAFNEAALEQAKQIQLDTGVELERVWSAEAGACEVCAGLDGVVVGLNEQFPEGEPGSIHPHCACVDEIRVKKS